MRQYLMRATMGETKSITMLARVPMTRTTEHEKPIIFRVSTSGTNIVKSIRWYISQISFISLNKSIFLSNADTRT